MDKHMNMEPKHDDALGRRLAEVRTPAFPSGLEERIMQKVTAQTAHTRKPSLFLLILAAVAGAAAVVAIVYFAFSYAGIDLSGALKPDPAVTESFRKSMAIFDTPVAGIGLCAFVVGVIYLSINGIISGKARRKALMEEK